LIIRAVRIGIRVSHPSIPKELFPPLTVEEDRTFSAAPTVMTFLAVPGAPMMLRVPPRFPVAKRITHSWLPAAAQQLTGQRGINDPHFVTGDNRQAGSPRPYTLCQKATATLQPADLSLLAFQLKSGTTLKPHPALHWEVESAGKLHLAD